MLGVTETRDFYHLVESASPTRDDFRSYAERGMPYDREDPEACEMATGVSVNATLARVRSRARVVASLKKYRFVAVLRIPVDGSILFKRTGRQRGHYTVWVDPQVLADCVESVVPVDAVD
jgi:hypothetical protein